MGSLKIFILVLLALYFFLLLVFRLLYPKKNAHRMVSFWVTLGISTVVVTGAITLFVLFAIGGHFKP